MIEIHWIESEDERGFATWDRYVKYSHWGIFLTGIFPRYFYHENCDSVLSWIRKQPVG